MRKYARFGLANTRTSIVPSIPTKERVCFSRKRSYFSLRHMRFFMKTMRFSLGRMRPGDKSECFSVKQARILVKS